MVNQRACFTIQPYKKLKSDMQKKEVTDKELDLRTLNSNLHSQPINIKLGDVRGVSMTRSQEVSAFHLIVWVFAIKHKLDDDQIRRVKAMYGYSHDIIDPITPSLESFNKVMQTIKAKNKRCVIKVVVGSKLMEQILEVAKKNDQIIQIFLYKSKATNASPQDINNNSFRSEIIARLPNTSPLNTLGENDEEIDQKAVRSEVLLRNRKLVGIFYDFNQIIERAERQVETFTKTFRTFENSHCLVGDFEKITRYRLRLIASIKLKVSDYFQTLKAFKQFVLKTIPWLNAHLEDMGQNGFSSFSILNSIRRYEIAASRFLQAEENQAMQKDTQITDKENCQSKTEGLGSFEALQGQFFHQMVSIYQDDGFFYHLLNSNLKLLGQRGASWKQLALPFSHMHRAIKHLYQEGLRAKSYPYHESFTVFRAGRARKSQLQRYAGIVKDGGAFIEMFGFLSTSLSAKIVADKFAASRYSRDGGSEGEGVDEDVLFCIKVNPISAIFAQKYNHLVNGFFRLTSKQSYGEAEQEILFNAMNIFRLVKISKEPLSSLFTEAEREEAAINVAAAKSLPESKYREEQARNNYYKKVVTIVELEFGSFYEALLANNKYDLSPAERAARGNFTHCMHQMGRFEKFDFADACELTKQPQESYWYLKSKVGTTEQDLYLSSKVDNKNYFSRLSSVCQKLGKTKQAINYSEIAINCYKMLENVHLNEVFNAHYKRLVEMQTRCIEILQQNSNFTAAEEQLSEQLLMIRSKSNSDPKVKLLESRVYINQAINYYSMGKLEECINRFDKCERQLAKTILEFSFQTDPIPILCTDFLAQTICPNPLLSQRFFTYKAYITALQENNRKERERQLVQRHGSKEQLERTSKLASGLLVMAKEAVKNRNTLFKSRKKYEDFIAKFSQQFQLSSYQSNTAGQKDYHYEIQSKIMQKRQKISSLDPKCNEYSKLFSEYNELIEQRSQVARNSLSTQSSENSASLQEQDRMFKRRQRQRKIREYRDRILSENKHQLVQEYLRCTNQIEQAIDELRAQGYVESSLSILKMRVQKSKIYQECDQRTAAMNEIEQIIKSGLVEGEYRYVELASAYSTRGKIHLEMKQVQLAIQSINQALECFSNTVILNKDDQIYEDASQASINQHGIRKKADQFNGLQHKNDYLQARILKLKALLMWIEIKRARENGISRNIFRKTNNQIPWQMKHSNEHMRFIQTEISQVKLILRRRSTLEDMDQLRCEILEVETFYYLNSERNQNGIDLAFVSLAEYLMVRSNQEGKQNQKSTLFCCDLIYRNSQRNDVLLKFIRFGHKDWLKSMEFTLQSGVFAWKVQLSYYFLEKAQGKEDAARQHLQSAIEILEVQIANKHDASLEEELNSLKWRLNDRPGRDLKKEQDEFGDFLLPMQSTIIRRLKRSQRLNNNRYQAIRQNENSVQISNSSTKVSQLNARSIMIQSTEKPNPESSQMDVQFSSLTLRQFCKNIGKSKEVRKKATLYQQEVIQ